MSRLIKYTISALLVGVYWYCLPTPVLAAIQITEVYPNPTSGQTEWIELYNDASSPVDLAGWKLEDVLTNPSTIHSFAANEQLAAQSYLVITLTTAVLNNAGDGVTLKDQTGSVIASMNYPSSTASKSWSLIDQSWELSTPTQGSANPTPSPSPSSSPLTTPSPTPSPAATPTPIPTPSPNLPVYPLDTLSISEILACPLPNQPEWIELYNSDTTSLDLTDWYIQDASGNQRLLEGTVPAHSWATISWSGSLLNNTGDTVKLYTPDHQLLDVVQFDDCVVGRSWIADGLDWRLTTTPTPGTANSLTTADVASKTTTTATASTSAQISSTTTSKLKTSPTPNPTVLAVTDKVTPSASPKPDYLQDYPLQSLHQLDSPLPQIAIVPSPDSNSSPDPYLENTAKAKYALASVILGGLTSMSIAGYWLYVWYQQKVAPHLLAFP